MNFIVNQQDLLMETDTGAAVSIISQVYEQSFADLPLEGARAKTFIHGMHSSIRSVRYCGI